MLAGVSSIALGLLLVVYLFVGLSIYLAVIWQISARSAAAAVSEGDTAPRKTFGLPEAFLAVAIITWVLIGITVSATRSPVQMTTHNLLESFLFTLFVVCLVAAWLKLRRIDIGSLGGFSRTSLKRAISTGIILLLAATPLILLA